MSEFSDRGRRGRARVVTVGALAAALLAALVVAGCGSSSDSSSSSTAGGGGEGPYKVVLSNNFLGNPFRTQMLNGMEALAKSPKYSGKVEFSIKNAEQTPSAQIASIQQITREGPDAILIDAGSETALNPVVKAACDQGILVYSFDQPVTEPCAYRLPLTDFAKQGEDMASFICAATGGKGSVLWDTGLPNVPLAIEYQQAWKETIAAKCPELETAATYQSGFSPGPELQAVSTLLSRYPDVTGVLSDESCEAVGTAFERAGLEPVPMTCAATNGNAKVCTEKKLTCFLEGVPPIVGSRALANAISILEGKELPKEELGSETNYTTNADGLDWEPVTEISTDVKSYPSLSKDLLLPAEDKEIGITPEDMLGQ